MNTFTVRPLRLLLLSLAALAAAAPALAQWSSDAKLDPKRIINESKQFLKEREPDLTAEENAIYEKATQLLENRQADALKLLEGIGLKAGAADAASPAFTLLLGNVYYASGAIDKAEACYRNAVDRYPSFLRAWINLGVLNFSRGRYDAAIPCFAKAVTLGSREATTFGMMGVCLEKTGDAVGAETAYIQALAGDPGNGDWMDGLLHVYLASSQFSRAEVLVRNLIKERPSEPSYRLIHARIMIATSRKLEAIALLEQARAAHIAGAEELAALTGLYIDEQLIPEALQTYDQLKPARRSLDPERALQLARLLTGRREWDRAQASLDDVRPRLDEAGRRAALQIQADLLAGRQDWQGAKRTIDELLRLDPMNGPALVSLGRICLATGDTAHAQIAFEAAEQTPEGARPAHLALARLELAARHYTRSVSHLQQALELGRDPELEELLTRVRTLLPEDQPPRG